MHFMIILKKSFWVKKVNVLFLIGALLLNLFGFSLYINTASAAQLSDVSDTLASSAPSTATNHTLAWTTPTGVATGLTIDVTLDPTGNAFTVGFLGVSDFVGETGITVVSACTGGPTNEATLATTTESFTLTICGGGDSIPASTAISLPITGSKITNPASPGSYVVRIGGTQTDSADTRVAIISQVTMSAIVPTSLTFTIAGVASSTLLAGGQQTSTTTSATAIGFGNLDVGDDEIGAQLLTVSTNASNGFQVTVVQNQNLTSSGLDDIDLFKDGSAEATPTAWTSPLNTLGSEATYGHYGLTSDDTGLTAGNEFVGGTLYAGNFNTARQVMYNTGPSNGTLVGLGTTTVAFRIQISPLQEPATDYNNVLTYVCTPIF
jgi:hypothetical protein